MAAEVPAVFPEVSTLPAQAGMPDPLIGGDGKAITTAAQWTAQRARMKAIIQHYFLGHAPPPPGVVTGKELAVHKVLDGTATCRVMRISFGPDAKLSFRAVLFIPAATAAHKAPFPVIVHPSFDYKMSKDNTTEVFNDIAKTFAQPLQRGMAVITFFYEEFGQDTHPKWRESGFFHAYPDYDWGDLAAWAWGMSRCVDYLQTQSFADMTKIIAVGHSRLGKVTLVAGAFDERFALTAPAGSGSGGTAAFRFIGWGRGGGQGLDDLIKTFPNWFGPRFDEFSGQVDKLPFDQHWLLALVAPRLCLPADGMSDGCTRCNALAKAYFAAKPVYALLGAPDHLGLSFRSGGHFLYVEDWDAILDFADLHLRKQKITRRFDTLPPAQVLTNGWMVGWPVGPRVSNPIVRSGLPNLLKEGKESRSRKGNQDGSIVDGYFESWVVTWNNKLEKEDWYAVTLNAAVKIKCVVFGHGVDGGDGGWFDTSAGKPKVQIQSRKDGDWITVGELGDYPATTAKNSAGIKNGQFFTCELAKPVAVFAVRVIGQPASGKITNQNYSSCSELQAFEK